MHRSSLSLGITRGGGGREEAGKPHSIPNNNRPSIVPATRFNEINESMRHCLPVYDGGKGEGVSPPLSLSSVFLFFARDQQSFVSNWSRGGDGSSPLLFACLGCLSDTTTRPIKDTLSRVDWMEGVVNNGLVTAIVSLRIFGLVSILLVGFFYSNSWQHNV